MATQANKNSGWKQSSRRRQKTINGREGSSKRNPFVCRGFDGTIVGSVWKFGGWCLMDMILPKIFASVKRFGMPKYSDDLLESLK